MAENTTANKSNFSNLWILLLVLLVIAASILILREYWMQYTADTKHLRHKSAEINMRIDNLHKDVSNILANRSAQETAEQNQHDIMRAFRLTKLAAETLQYSRDVPLAQQLLQAAQEDLQDSTAPGVDKVRQMLVADQQKIAAVKFAEVATITDKVDALQQLIAFLEVKGAPQKVIVRPMADENNPAAKNTTPQWQQTIANVITSVKNSVKVRKKSDVELDMAFANAEYKRARFSLLLEQIRWAAYYGDTTIYNRSIKETQELLEQVFNDTNPNVQKFKQILTELAAIQVNPALPNLQETVNALQALLVG